MKKLFILLILLTSMLVVAQTAHARIGVGVGIGKIEVDEELKPGTIYQLPSFTVLNTGDETADYGVSIEYHEKQLELKPEEDWFIFSPDVFTLEPGAVQQVDVKLNLPLKVKPGDYFAYLEAHPLKKAEEGGTRVGVAAAAKLYFTVVPANMVQGLYFKAASFWSVYAPWPQRAAAGLLVMVLILIVNKFFNIQIRVRKSSTEKRDEEHEEKNQT